MYQFLRSKKAFTMVELLIVVMIMGILSAVAIPIYINVGHKQKKQDCENQIAIIKANVTSVMGGMEDNGKPITYIKLDAGLFAPTGSGASQYWLVKQSSAPTIGAMRYGKTVDDPTAKSYLKKSAMNSLSFLTLFVSSEFPVCPFDKAGTAGYRIYADGTVKCNCPTCPNYVA